MPFDWKTFTGAFLLSVLLQQAIWSSGDFFGRKRPLEEDEEQSAPRKKKKVDTEEASRTIKIIKNIKRGENLWNNDVLGRMAAINRPAHKQMNKFNKIVFLGTSSAIPTTKRNMSAMCITLTSGSSILVDCAEGTQHQFLRTSLKPSHINLICITHLHGDHCYGLFGMLHSMSQQVNFLNPVGVVIVGPKGIKEMLATTFMLSGGVPFRDHLQVIELTQDFDGEVCTVDDITVYACPIQHRVPTFGYVFQEQNSPGSLDGRKAKALGAKGRQLGDLKNGNDVTLEDGTVVRAEDVLGPEKVGRKVSVLWDTMESERIRPYVQNSDLMIHEATYHQGCHDKAIAHAHSTAEMAGIYAEETGAKQLILTHFSPRYEKGYSGINEDDDDQVDVDDLQKEAAAKFSGSVHCACDFACFSMTKKKGFVLETQEYLKQGTLFRDYVVESRRVAAETKKKMLEEKKTIALKEKKV